jgi:hypothetical protein
MNNISFDYIGAIGTHTITDYIDINSNILNDKIDITSNFLNNNIDELTSNTYHININNPNCLINTSNTIDFINGGLSNVNNTYIYNNYQYGEIRFKIKDDDKYYIKIGRDGKLYLWITYNILKPEILEGWYEVSDILADYFFNLAIINGVLTTYGADLVYLQEQVNVLDAGVGAIDLQIGGIIGTLQIHTQQINELIALQPESLVSSYLDDELLNPNDIVNNIIFNGVNSVSRLSTGIQSMINLGGLGLIGWIGVGTYNYFARLREEQQEKNLRLNNIYGTLLLNSNISNLDVPDINNPGRTLKENLYSNIFSNMENTNNLEIFYTSNMITTLGFINSNIQTQQIIPNLYSSNLKTSLLNLNSGNIVNVNNITSSGKIKENNLYLSDVYATINNLNISSNTLNTNISNLLYNLAYNYSAERQYPPKLYTSTSIEETATLLGKIVYKQIIFLDTSSISYGSGYYEIYSSSTYDTSTTKDKLFNFNTTETTTSARWGISLYNSGTGNYQGDNSIDGSYYGDWVIIKLPQPIMLTRYRIYQRTDFPTKAPSLWRVYGSNDGITFTQITEAHQTTRLTTYSADFYEKSLNPLFTTLYSYIGFAFGSLLSTSGQTDLSFAELQIFGKEIISNTIISNIYTTSNAVKSIVEFDMPVLAKHYAFYILITTPININGTTYYKYDINLSSYTKKGFIQIGGGSNDPYRIFKIRAFYATSYFSTLVNGLADVVFADIFMSFKANSSGGLGSAGLNICSIGNIPNPNLTSIPSNNLFFMRNGAGSIDYITVVSKSAADVRVVIEDLLG